VWERFKERCAAGLRRVSWTFHWANRGGIYRSMTSRVAGAMVKELISGMFSGLNDDNSALETRGGSQQVRREGSSPATPKKCQPHSGEVLNPGHGDKRN